MDYMLPQFIAPSGRWLVWLALQDIFTCIECKTRNGKILDITKSTNEKPPLHPKCRCMIFFLLAIAAGTATMLGKQGADWIIKQSGILPREYLTKRQANALGWVAKMGNLTDIAPGCMIGGDEYINRNGHLPSTPQRVWYEADINYSGGFRGLERIVYSNDGLIFVTYDHYETFYEIR